MARLTLDLPDDLRARLRSSATRRGVSETDLIQEAVQAYLGGETPPTPGSCLALVQDLCGSLDGPADLSTNPTHMEGYGRS